MNGVIDENADSLQSKQLQTNGKEMGTSEDDAHMDSFHIQPHHLNHLRRNKRDDGSDQTDKTNEKFEEMFRGIEGFIQKVKSFSKEVKTVAEKHFGSKKNEKMNHDKTNDPADKQ